MVPKLPTPSLSHTEPQSASNTILRNAITAADALRKVSDFSSGVPFLHSISVASVAIFAAVQAVKVNKDEYTRMVAQIQELLWVVIETCVDSKTEDVLPPSTLNNIGSFARTLHKILSCVEGHLKQGKIRRFFRQGEQSQQLEECKTELKHVLEMFSVHHGVAGLAALARVQNEEAARQEQLLELISTFQATATISSGFSSYASDSVASTSSLSSLLPPSPKIFHGRESELQELLDIFLQDSARSAILGPGGIGKTSLAKALLHAPAIAAKYGTRRCFVPCDSASTPAALLSLLAAHVAPALAQSQRATPKVIIRQLSARPSEPVLIVLDNFETIWESGASRAEIENFLGLLADLAHVALLLTMRGAERPAQVRWTRPFLAPLTPLTYDAARQTFFDIADEEGDDAHARELLRLADRLPLAVSLVANLVAFEGSETVLRRWKEESTTLLSEGGDRRSNLDMSIMLSVSSPRVLSVPGAQQLLGVLSLLPDGISAPELVQIAFPIQQLNECKTALLRTSVAYVDREERLKVLVPIREYVLSHHPPTAPLVRPLRAYLDDVLMLWKSFRQISPPDCIPRITANMGNFHAVLDWCLRFDEGDIAKTLGSILNLDSFSRATGHGISDLMKRAPDLADRACDPRLVGEYVTALFECYEYHQAVSDPQVLAKRGIEAFKAADDRVGEVQLYNAIGSYYWSLEDNSQASGYFHRALELAIQVGDAGGETKALMHLSEVEWLRGQFQVGRGYSLQAQQAARRNGHLLAEAHCLKMETYCLTSLGDYKASLQRCARARTLLGLCGLRGGELDVAFMNCEGDVRFFKSEYQESRSLHVQILEKTSEVQSPTEYAYAHLNIAIVDAALGAEEPTVHRSLSAARAMFTQIGSPGGIAFCDLVAADLQLRRGQKAEPLQCYRRYLSRYWTRMEVASMCLDKLADPTFNLCDLTTTLEYAIIFLGLGRKNHHMLALHTGLRCLGDVYSAEGDEETAVALFTLALEGFTAMDVHASRADCMVRLGALPNGAGILRPLCSCGRKPGRYMREHIRSRRSALWMRR